VSEKMEGMESIFEDVPDLISWLAPEDIVQKAFLVCKTWRQDIQQHPQHVWIRLIYWKWPVFVEIAKGNYPIYSPSPAELNLEIHSMIKRLNQKVNETILFDRHNKNVMDRNLTFGLHGFNNGHCTMGETFVVQSLQERGYNEIGRTEQFIQFRVKNKGLWLYCQHGSRLTEIRRVIEVSSTGYEARHLVYFNCLAMTVMNCSITHGWSGYNNGRAQNSKQHVIQDFRQQGYVVVKETPLEIVFEKSTH
jgi:hypothetical protein